MLSNLSMLKNWLMSIIEFEFDLFEFAAICRRTRTILRRWCGRASWRQTGAPPSSATPPLMLLATGGGVSLCFDKMIKFLIKLIILDLCHLLPSILL